MKGEIETMTKMFYVFGTPIEEGAHEFDLLVDHKPDGTVYIPCWKDECAVIRAFRGGKDRGYFAGGAELLSISDEDYEIAKEMLKEEVAKAKKVADFANATYGTPVLTAEDILLAVDTVAGTVVTDHRGVAHYVVDLKEWDDEYDDDCSDDEDWEEYEALLNFLKEATHRRR